MNSYIYSISLIIARGQQPPRERLQLEKHREIKGSDKQLVLRKVALQVSEWDQRSRSEVQARDRGWPDKKNQKWHLEACKKVASERTSDAQREVDRLRGVLRQIFYKNEAIDWEKLEDKSEFHERQPMPKLVMAVPLLALPREPMLDDVTPRDTVTLRRAYSFVLPEPMLDDVTPREPMPEDESYQPKFSALAIIFPSLRVESIAEARRKVSVHGGVCGPQTIISRI